MPVNLWKKFVYPDFEAKRPWKSDSFVQDKIEEISFKRSGTKKVFVRSFRRCWFGGDCYCWFEKARLVSISNLRFLSTMAY